MLSLMSKRESVAASAESTASLPAITSLMIVRLMRARSVTCSRRCRTALGTSSLVAGSSQHDESAVGLEEDREQAVQHLGKHLAQAPGPG